MIMKTKRCNIIRAPLCSVLSLWLMLSAFVGVSAAGCEFSLSDAQTGVGRLLTVSLECEGASDICAFVAEIEYDATAVEYKSSKVTGEAAELSIYTAQAGKLRLVYLCEEGVNCIDKTPLVEFTFKALKSGTCQLSAAIHQVIDSSSSDVQVNRSIPAVISINASDSVKSAYKGSTDNTHADKSVQSDIADASDTESGFVYVRGKAFSVVLIVSAVAAALSVVCLAALFAYKLGVRRAGKKE
ncbi:MAG: hypothetical protein IJ298_06660 [Ruminococcus sp.]|nr:hypothetical protein [Ruminococcus sp.]